MLLNQDIKNIHIVIYSEKGLNDMKHYFKMLFISVQQSNIVKEASLLYYSL